METLAALHPLTLSYAELLWIAIGLAGQLCFTGRMLLQWCVSELRRESVVPVAFWYLSLAGGLTLLTYAIYRRDPVFILGQSTGVFIYVRNLMLIYRSRGAQGWGTTLSVTTAGPTGQAAELPRSESALRPGREAVPFSDPAVAEDRANCELSLVCPAFNEQANLAQLLAEWHAALEATGRSYEMLLVDDASTDGTPALLGELMGRYASLRVLRLQQRSGQSAALAAGFEAARGAWIVTSDADLQNDPADLPRLLALADRYDLVCGWRRGRRDPWLKRLISRLANARRRRLLNDGVRDTGCGLKLFRRAVAQRVLKFDGMHRFFPALARIEGFSVTEVPVNHRPRTGGQSKYHLFNRLRKPVQDLRAVAWYQRRKLRYRAEELRPQRPSAAAPLRKCG